MTVIPTPQTADDERKFANGLDVDGNLTFAQVGIEDISYKGRFGALAYSTTENDVSIGTKYFVLNVDEGKFRVGDDILVTSTDDQDCFMWGEIVGSDTVWEPRRLLVYVDDISDLIGTFQNWELQVVARPKPGIEKDTSTTSVDPTDGGPWTFQVTASKFFPIGGTLLIKPTTDRTIAVIGEVKAYNSTSLTVTLRATNATVSQAYTSWSIALLDSPPAPMALFSVSGLTITTNYTSLVDEVTVSAGSVMDSTNTVLLTLDDAMTKDLLVLWSAGDGGGAAYRVPMTGTISVDGNLNVTGTSTLFTTELGPIGTPPYITGHGLNDYFAAGGGSNYGPILSSATDADYVDSVTSDTVATLGTSDWTATNVAFYRGGPTNRVTPFARLYHFVVIIRKDSDGSIDFACVSATPSGEPDLPSGYTYYRCIGTIITLQGDAGATHSSEILHHLAVDNAPYAPKRSEYIVLDTEGDLPNASRIANSTSNSIFGSAGGTTEVRRSALTGDVTASANSNATTIANDAVTNAKLDNMAAYTLKARNAGTTGDPSDIDISALTEKTTLADDDLFLIQDSAASNAFKKAKKSNVSTGGGTTFPTDMGLVTEAATITFDCGTIV